MWKSGKWKQNVYYNCRRCYCRLTSFLDQQFLLNWMNRSKIFINAGGKYFFLLIFKVDKLNFTPIIVLGKQHFTKCIHHHRQEYTMHFFSISTSHRCYKTWTPFLVVHLLPNWKRDFPYKFRIFFQIVGGSLKDRFS